MNLKMAKKLKKLTSFPSVSGNEGKLALWLKKEMEPFSKKTWIDPVGNLLAIKGKPKVAIFAHLDKVGYMISQIGKNEVRAVPLSKGKGLPGSNFWQVEILGKKKVKGLLYEKDKPEHKLAVIVENSLKDIAVGDFIALSPNFSLIADNLVYSQGLDNKLGVLAAINIFMKSSNLAFVGTVKEEAFKLGAKIAARELKPKSAIILDVTYDENPQENYPIKVGKGPAICLKDDLLPDKSMVSKLTQCATKYNIKHQLEVLESGGSNAKEIYDLFAGIPFVFVGIPIKFMHTANEIGSLSDLGEAVELISHFLAEFGGSQ